ncbi:hypothetical protein A2U01_0072116 [Trifolium medium]|uniref:Uncharacterized protein n=1 Tax=Trifolium medium TaxID=97028 RepID=A0A392SR27_9FABA|nr:hypothetical protein [Trifolium medium]
MNTNPAVFTSVTTMRKNIKHSKQFNELKVVNELPQDELFGELSSIPGGNNSWSDFTYVAAQLWITGVPFS